MERLFTDNQNYTHSSIQHVCWWSRDSSSLWLIGSILPIVYWPAERWNKPRFLWLQIRALVPWCLLRNWCFVVNDFQWYFACRSCTGTVEHNMLHSKQTYQKMEIWSILIHSRGQHCVCYLYSHLQRERYCRSWYVYIWTLTSALRRFHVHHHLLPQAPLVQYIMTCSRSVPTWRTQFHRSYEHGPSNTSTAVSPCNLDLNWLQLIEH